MSRGPLVDLGKLGRGVDGPVELPGAEGLDRIEPGKQPAAVEHLALGPSDLPPDVQPLEQHRREHHVAILAALALLDAQGHRLHPGHQFLMIEGDVEEELQPADRRVERDRRDAVIDQVELIVP